MLKLENVTKYYDFTKGVENLSISIPKGKVLGLLGNNGSGKTTTFRLLLGLLEHQSGTITYLGEPIDRSDKRLFGYLPEERSMLRDLTVKDQIFYLGRLKKMSDREIGSNLREWLKFFHMEHVEHRKIMELSKGNQQKVQMICALIHNPEILIFDEPLNGLDINNVELFQQLIFKLKKEKKIILLSSHLYDTIEIFCDYVLYLKTGDVLFQGELVKLKKKCKHRYITLFDTNIYECKDYPGVVSYEQIGTSVILKIEDEDKALRIIKTLIRDGIYEFRLELPSLKEIIKEQLYESND